MNAAVLVQQQYARLGKTGKPQAGEWTVLAGFVLTLPSAEPRVVALGTGTKCLTAAQVGADAAGSCLHDTHAEVCARRSLLLYLMREIERCASDTTAVVQPAAGGCGYELRPGVELHMYSSAPPCGDAAVFGTPDAGEPATTTAGATGDDESEAKRQRLASTVSEERCDKAAPATCLACAPAASAVSTAERSTLVSAPESGRGGALTGGRPVSWSAACTEAAAQGRVCHLGLARTKPGRGERTCCMSCSDKIARWQAVGLQGALLSLLVRRASKLSGWYGDSQVGVVGCVVVEE